MTDRANVLAPFVVEDPENSELSWLAVWTKPRAEKRVAQRLNSLSVGHYLPTLTHTRRWSDRWKEIEVPLFPSYLFARIPIREWPRVLRVPGVLTVLKQGNRPAPISEREISELKMAVERVGACAHGVDVIQDFLPGDRARIVNGPMAGLIGVVREIRGGRRLLMGVNQLGRALAIGIGSADVEPYRD